jgi:hypothetical protein
MRQVFSRVQQRPERLHRRLQRRFAVLGDELAEGKRRMKNAKIKGPFSRLSRAVAIWLENGGWNGTLANR